MVTYPNIDPVAFHIGPLSVHWYGLMYLLGFLGAWGFIAYRVKKQPARGFTVEQVTDILFYAALGVIVGGRLGYMLFYDWPNFIAAPQTFFKVWQGGMSFHGGLLGVIIALWIYSCKINKNLIDIADLIAPAVPIGLATGRIGNFINGELWGKISDVPWAMIFPTGGPYPRHPSQLYEFFLEGVLLFLILWWFSRKPRPRGAVSALFLIGYGCFRFIIEFFRVPDVQIGYLAFGWVTEGQLLSLPMILIGIIILVFSYWRAKQCNNI